MTKRIPVSAAKEFAKKYGKDQVIVVCWDHVSGKHWITTYGVDKEQCAMAALGGDRIAATFGLKMDDS